MSNFSELSAAPIQLWVVLGMKFFEATAFFSLMYILSKYLSEELGFSDVQAGWLFAFCAGMQFPFALVLSFLLDSWGIRKMCIMGQTLLLGSRFVLWMGNSPMLVIVTLVFFYPMGTAALFPAMVVGVKRYCPEQCRSYAFGIFYVAQNVSSLASAGILNYFRHHSEGSSDLYNHVLGIGLISCAIGFCGSFVLTDPEEPVVTDSEAPPAPLVSKFESAMQTFQSSTFWRFMAVICSFIMIRMVFGHLNATFPKWMTREFGEETPYELYIGINPALIIVLVPICTRICEMLQLKTETALMVGACISGFSPFVLACIAPTEIAAAAFIVIFSIGEAIWSPKLYEYTVSVPQEGREGVYVACGSAPLYLAKFVAGAASGYLLRHYCPTSDEGSVTGCQTRALWMAIAATTSITPVILMCCRTQLFANGQDDANEGSALLKKSVN